MKHRLTAYFVSVSLCPVLAAQDAATATIPSEGELPLVQSSSGPLPVKSTRTFIPHALEVSRFTPPAPVVRKPLPVVRIDAAVTQQEKNSRTLTLLRGEASTAPDLPPPPPPSPYVAPHEPTPEEIAQRIWQQRHTFDLGAFVFDHKTSVVHWTDPISHVQYEAVCGFDIGLLAAVGRFVHLGENYSFSLIHGDYNTTVARRMASFYHSNYPQVGEGQIVFVKGDLNDRAATKPMTVIKEILAAEKPRLLSYQADRKTYAAASAAWHAAHPPIPQDETFLFLPHRGSRYLANPQPEKQGAAR